MAGLYATVPRPQINGNQPPPVPPQDLLTLDPTSITSLNEYMPQERTDFLQEGPDNHGARNDTGLPHVTLTYAQSLDSQIALQSGVQTLLSGRETKAMTHYLRTQHDAILVGAGTANADNPGLNSRFSYDGKSIVDFAQQPRPFVLDPGKSWKAENCDKVFELAKNGLGRAPWLIISDTIPHKDPADATDKELDEGRKVQSSRNKIWEAGGSCINAGIYEGRAYGVNWEEILHAMWKKGIRSVMIEGGAMVINDLLREKNQHLISTVIVTIAPIYLGNGGVVVSPPRTYSHEAELVLPKESITWIQLGKDIVMASSFSAR